MPRNRNVSTPSDPGALPRGREIAGELEQHRRYLMRVARLQLRDSDLVEDVVQETMLAALAATGFSEHASLRTWLTGILKHKIVDVIRKRHRRSEVSRDHREDTANPLHEVFDSPYDDDGEWAEKPTSWGDPEQAVRQREFLDVLAICMENLPASTARVFVMREYMELEVAEISTELELSPAYIYVLLYRARATLRRCLEKKWFAGEAPR
ncbi:MAG: sigma-70 family RNA polymerase sigma factor [Pseudomonadota bacterium]|nr:sigma-70 family RNA polymerase sigma factor [Pseudomonadota bacterium]